MAAVGIEKGKPFAPDDKMKKVLTDAAAIGNAAARAVSYSPRNPGQFVYDGNKTWVMGYANKSTTYTSEHGARDLEGRVFFHFGYICVSPAMALTVPGAGSDYAMAAIDSKGAALDGSRTYKLNLPANPPAMPPPRRWRSSSSKRTASSCSRTSTRSWPSSTSGGVAQDRVCAGPEVPRWAPSGTASCGTTRVLRRSRFCWHRHLTPNRVVNSSTTCSNLSGIASIDQS